MTAYISVWAYNLLNRYSFFFQESFLALEFFLINVSLCLNDFFVYLCLFAVQWLDLPSYSYSLHSLSVWSFHVLPVDAWVHSTALQSKDMQLRHTKLNHIFSSMPFQCNKCCSAEAMLTRLIRFCMNSRL